ncbi:type II toxin-antitoxin system RatA family toxin [Thalassotalea sediminis]|uniref:type II toxin-antitoxin system RatA family toxin n=1 Tax=Thalassotalea sediminis TaxID=1759089 RepID=UPI0025724F70|nr:type II toxin-antitoxin system RatA family toxin [Thalassotalea sediminis]
MPVISRNALVMFSTEQMFELINDVQAYPQFLPDCGDSKIIKQDANKMTASLLVSKGGLKKWFTTENTLVNNKEVSMSLLDGPFKYLTGKWQLIPLSEDACKVSLHLDYEFSSKVLDLAFGPVFNGIANSMVQAFTERAKQVYGANIG